ncbi:MULTISPECIES: hypothetical protein [Pseudomonas]|uniref:Secreted protein n=1 Tax=Pseudomonas juntendi TaxID=2666183 RepID=A0ABZ2J7U3_9PSED|nr:hypothetical protein [Pseudomonas sp. BJP69]QDR69268.1 hypothetical protein FPB55_17360 [Pseudomonas sp. BJP69]WHL27811.1 hypothetical protein QJS63_26530 [Pseudomonas juntendi]WHL28138.1 hypothetical protein QJS63_00010 [Pseudomonas juntendi]
MTRLALCLLLLATGASADPRETRGMPYVFQVFHDEQRAVTCWSYSGGLSCIPDSQLQAGNQRQLSPHETQPEPTPAMAPGRWIDERYEL